MSQYLGDISAYALAVSQGYTGTEEEYAELMASYATVGQTAVNAAQTATTKASEAATSATTATNKASEATTAATTATNKAAEAQADADAAALDASQALSAASTATTKATEATTAAATAVSAKDDAVSANTAAQSAKTAAQTAQTGAETAAASVSASAAQIATNTEDITQLKSDFTTTASKEDMLKSFPTDTASGAVASFADGANVPVKSLIVNIDPVQSGSGDSSPENVRPITGWTGANVVRTGKNLLYANAKNETKGGLTFTVVGNGSSFYVNGNATANVALTLNSGAIASQKLKKGLTYTLSGGHWSSVGVAYIQLIYQGDVTGSTISIVSADGPKTVTLDEDATLTDIYITFRSGNTFNNDLVKPQLELGSTATDYEPYSGQTYSITFPSEAGTVYGGTLDVTSGVLTVDRASVDLGTWNWTMYSTSQGNLFRTPSIVNAVLEYDGLNIICSSYPTVKASQREDKSMSIGSDGKVDIIDSNYSDASAFKTAMNGVQLVYELVTPTTYTLTPQEITSLLGTNNLWADSGDSEVTYRADPTLYIGRLTEPDADMVADANITSGQYFMVGNTLYKATANIASGATISPNVNCTRKSLSEALNELNA